MVEEGEKNIRAHKSCSEFKQDIVQAALETLPPTIKNHLKMLIRMWC